MARFRTRYGVVSFKSKAKTRSNPRKKTAKKASSRSPHKAYSKKVGNWRCECKGRTVTCAGAKHTYADHGTACAVYKRITSAAAVKRFVDRYGKKATKAAVGAKKTAKTRTKAKSRRNPPLSQSEAATMKRVLRKHGYL